MYLGLITPHSLLGKFMTAVENLPDVTLIPLVYLSIAEAPRMVNTYQDRVEAMFFAGPSPYFLSLHSVERTIPWYYLGLPTGGILAALLQARSYLNDTSSFSLDSISEPEVRQVLNEAGVNVDRIITYTYAPSERFEEEMVAFHSRCFREENVRFCLTCQNLTQIRLAESGIPAFYISPTVHSMRDAIGLCSSFFREQSADHLRTVVGYYAIEGEEAEDAKICEAEEFIRDFARRKNILMIRKSPRLFQGLFNYGQFLLLSKDFSRSLIVEEFSKKFPHLRLRTGYGLSAMTRTAEDWAEKALETSRHEAHNPSYLFDGQAYRGMGEKPTFELSPRERRFAQKLQITEATLLRYMRTFRAMEKTFSAREFANAVGIHPKSSRKILNRFLGEGFLEPRGKRPAVTIGRPEVLYGISPPHSVAAEIETSHQSPKQTT